MSAYLADVIFLTRFEVLLVIYGILDRLDAFERVWTARVIATGIGGLVTGTESFWGDRNNVSTNKRTLRLSTHLLGVVLDVSLGEH